MRPFPPQTTRGFQEASLYKFGSKYAVWSTVAHLITTCVSGLTLIQQVMHLGDGMLQMEKLIKLKCRLGIAAETGNCAPSESHECTFLRVCVSEGCPNIWDALNYQEEAAAAPEWITHCLNWMWSAEMQIACLLPSIISSTCWSTCSSTTNF